MLFSIVIPVYNVEKYLDACLQSIYPQIQNRDDAHILLINDGSKDSSPAICDRYAAMDPQRIQVYHKSNEGLLLTRRFGYRKASGRYIISCDSDDMLEPGMIDALAAVIEEHDPDVIFYNATMLYEDREEPFNRDIFGPEKIKVVDKTEVAKAFYRGTDIVSMCMKAVKRTCLDLDFDYTPYARVSHGEDTLQSAEVLSNAQTFVYYNQSFYGYRMGSGMTARFDPRYYTCFKTINQRIENSALYRECPDTERLLDVKYFTNVGRAVTQARFDPDLRYSKLKEYLQTILSDPYFEEKKPLFSQARSGLRLSHKLFCQLLIRKQYWLIYVLLKAKNIL